MEEEEIYYSSSSNYITRQSLIGAELVEGGDDGEFENEHLPHSFSTGSNINNKNMPSGYVNSNMNMNNIKMVKNSINSNYEEGDNIISPSSPSGFAQHDLLASIHSGPTIESMSIDEDNMDNNIENGGSVGGNKKKSMLSRIWNFLTGNVIAHVMIWTNLTLFSGFLILSPYGLKIYNPIIFSFFRGLALVISLFPIMLLVDRKFKFRSETKLINRAFAFRKKYPSIYGSKYWGWIYSVFYDDKAVIPSFVLARLPNYRQAKQLAWCGVLAVVNQLLFVAGLNLTSSTVTGVMQPLVAIMVCCISMMLGRESKSFVKFFGSLIAAGGAVSMLVASALTKDPVNLGAMEADTFENLSPFERLPEYFALLPNAGPSKVAFMFGLLCLLGNTMSYSLYLVTQKTLLDKGVPPLTVTFWSFFFGLAVSFLSSLYFFPNFNYRRVDLRSIISVLYAAIPYGALQFSLSATASKMLTPTIVGVYSTFAPIVAVLTGVFAFGESPSPWILIGAALILVGVFVVIGHRYVETRANNKAKAVSASENEDQQQLETNDIDMEDKSISSTIYSSSAAILDVTPSSLQDDEEDTPNFKSI